MTIVFACVFCCVSAFATEGFDRVVRKGQLSGAKGISVADVQRDVVVAEPLSVFDPVPGVVAGESLYLSAGAGELPFPLIFNVQRKGEIFPVPLVGAQRDVTPYFPLYRLSAMLRFPSTIDLEKGVVRGTFFGSQNTYEVDALNLSYTVNGERAAVAPDQMFAVTQANVSPDMWGDLDIQDLKNEVYVTEDFLDKLWGLRPEFKSNALYLELKTPRKFSYELDRDRKKRQEYFERGDEVLPDVYHVRNDYKMLGSQSFVLSGSTNWQGKSRELNKTFNINGRGDLLGTGADYTLSGSSTPSDSFNLDRFRARFTRLDKGDNEYLPFGIDRLQFGDIGARASSLVGLSQSGRGIYISSDERDNRKAFDTVVIEGVSQPGWDVELYRGAELLDFQVVGDDGVYRFEDLQLHYGGNEFKVVLYGLQGQVEERVESHKISGRRRPVGEMSYEASVIDVGRDLFNITDRDQDHVGLAKHARVDLGLTRWATGFASFVEAPFLDENVRYYTFGAGFDALGGAGQVEVARQDSTGGMAYDLRFGRELLGFNANFHTTFYDDFESRTAGFGGGAREFDGAFHVSKGFNLGSARLGLSVGADHDRFADGVNRSSVSTSQSLGFDSGFAFGHSVSKDFDVNSDDSANGSLNATFPKFLGVDATASLGYTLEPNTSLDQARLSLRYKDGSFRSDLSGSYGLGNDSGAREVRAGVSYDFGDFRGGAQATWDHDRGIDVSLRASTTFGPDGPGGEYVVGTAYRDQVTAVKVRLFEDLDYDGAFSEGDVPVPDGRIKLDRRYSPFSDEDGVIDVIGAGAERLTYITLDEKVFGRSMLRPIKDGYSVVLRSGTKPYIEFPLYQTGMIDGTVKFPGGRGVGGMRVQLLNSKGEVVDEAETIFDGFYMFEFVRPGNYVVRLDPSYRINVPPKILSVSSEKGLFAYGVDFLLEQASEVAVTDNDFIVRDGGRVAHKTSAPVAVGTLKPAPTLSERPSYTAIRAVRIGEHPHKVRLVLDLSAPSVYQLSTEQDGAVINLDLKDTVWDVPGTWSFDDHPIFKSIKAYALPDGMGEGARIRLEAHKAARIFYNTTLPAEYGLPDRLYVDLIRKK